MIKNKLSELHIWLGEHEKFVLILLFSFTFLYGITFDEIPKIVLLILIIPLTALEVIRVGRVYVDFREPLVFLGLSTFYIFWGVNVFQGQGFALLCLILYVLSKYIVLSHCKKDTKMIIYYLVFFAVVLFILGILEYIPALKDVNITKTMRWLSFWKKEKWPRTAYDCYFVTISGLLAYAVHLIIKKKREGFFLLLLFFAALGITLYRWGRYVAVIALLTALICAGFILVKSRKSEKLKFYVVIMAALGTLVVLAVYIMHSNNIMGAAEIYKNSFWTRGDGILHNLRFSLKKKQLALLFAYPFGKCEVELDLGHWGRFSLVHDLWLDIARRGGLIPFTLVCTYSFVSTIDLIKVWKIEDVNIGTKICITGMFYAVNLLCWIEPIIVMRKSFWGITYMLAGLFRGIIIMDWNKKQIEI